MIRFSEDANKIIEDTRWQELNLRLEFRLFAQADWYNDSKEYQSVKNEAWKVIKEMKLIEWSVPKQRYTRTKLGKEISQLYS